jgi:hypothetical protein
VVYKPQRCLKASEDDGLSPVLFACSSARPGGSLRGLHHNKVYSHSMHVTSLKSSWSTLTSRVRNNGPTTTPAQPTSYTLLLLIQPSPLPQCPLSNILMHRINNPHSDILSEISTHTYCVIHYCMGWVWSGFVLPSLGSYWVSDA